MGITVTELITEAYYDSSVVARQFSTIQGYQLNDGLKWLNQILDDKAMDTGDIPYITQQYPLTGVVGQETYFIPNCISIDAITFYVGSVRYEMTYVDRVRYFQQPRANNINALPVSYTYERVYGGIKLWVYFWPQQPYLFNITGNFFMQNVSLNQDLTAQISTVNFGTAYTVGAGLLNANGLIINNVDLAGTYANIGALVDYINTGIIPNVTASYDNFQFTLTGQLNTSIFVVTDGVQNSANTIYFEFFSTISGIPLNQTYNPMGLDGFYTNYLELQLCERICFKLNFAMPEGASKQLDRYRLSISDMSEPLDLSQQKVSCLGDTRAINYAAVNIGRGYTVSGN